MTDRRLTINAKGEVVEQPYGLGRWHSPRARACSHGDCPNEAKILRTVPRAHNCCTEHEEDA